MKKSKFIEEFKQFIMRGNVVQMAIGIVVGAAFSAIVTAFVSGVINPLIGLLVGKVDFSNLRIVLQSATADSAEVAVMYGLVIQKLFEFLVIALCMFLVIRAMNKLEHLRKAKEEAEAQKKEQEKAQEPAPEPEDIVLLREIRDLLKKDNSGN